jgi:hypothetical protein
METHYVLTDKDREWLRKIVRQQALELQSSVPDVSETHVANGQVWLTPSGGIPARTGSYPNYTFGKATCVAADIYLDGEDLKCILHDPPNDTVIYNTSDTAIAGSKPIQVKYLLGQFPTVDVGDCA